MPALYGNLSNFCDAFFNRNPKAGCIAKDTSVLDETSGPDFMPRQGISLSTYSSVGYSDSRIVDMIDGAVALGANYVVLGNVNLIDLTSNVIADAIDNGINQTAPLADVAKAIVQAQAAGLSVVLKPQLATIDPAFDQYNSASWINLVNPDLKISDPAAFFASYKAMILEWGALAQKYGVDSLCIGNEMVAATKPEYTKYWLDIIADLRKVYDGDLTYAALAPVMTNAAANEITQIGFWDQLDYAGFDVFPSLTHTTTPTVEDLKQGWYDTTVYGNPQNYVEFLTEMAAHVGKPIVFAETGLPSFDGAADREATSDGMIDNGTRADDQQEQADWWQAFFEVWSRESPDWLQGIYAINNDPGDLGSYYNQNYNINGKLAEKVVASWFGGYSALGATASELAGGQGDDRLFLYDPATRPSGKTLAANLETVIEVVVTGSLIDGTAPTIRAIINGVDFGRAVLAPADSGYVSSDGTHFTVNSTFTFTLPGLVPIDQLKIVFASPETIGGASATTFYHSIKVNGVALTGGDYFPSEGHGGPYASTLPRDGDGGNSGQWAGGYTLFDASAWNAWLASDARGSASDPIEVTGGAGYDELHVLGSKANYTITRTGTDSVRLTESAGLNQNALISGIEKIVFADGSEYDLVAKPNSAPVLMAALADSVAPDNAVWSFQVPAAAFRDPDGDALTYSATLASGAALPDWLAFNAATRTFSGTPPHGFSGTIALSVIASDGKLSASDSFTLSVEAVNAAPVVSAVIAEQTAVAGDAWTFHIPAGTFADPDGDALTYSASLAGGDALPGWLRFDAATQTFSGVAPDGVSGTIALTVTASDGSASTSDTFQLAIAPDIRAPLSSGEVSKDWRLFTSAGFHGEIGGSGQIFGTNGQEEITILDLPGRISFDSSFNRGGDVIHLQGMASEWWVRQEGSGVVLAKDMTTIFIPAGSTGLQIGFADGFLDLRFDLTSGNLLVGDQVVANDLAQLHATPAATMAFAAMADESASVSARLFLADDSTVTLGGDYAVQGSNGSEQVALIHGNVRFDASFNRGNDIVTLAGDKHDFTASLSGSSVVFSSAQGDAIIPIGAEPLTVRFDDAETFVRFDADSYAVLIGDQQIAAAGGTILLG